MTDSRSWIDRVLVAAAVFCVFWANVLLASGFLFPCVSMLVLAALGWGASKP